MTGYPIISKSVTFLRNISFQGNVIPLTWYKTVLRTLPVDGGRKTEPKPDLVAISILADIVYWFRPIIERDEESGDIVGHRQKFKADKLQRSYKAYMEMYGLGEYQVKDAFDTLVNLGIVTLEFRRVEREGKLPLQNVMYIELNVPELLKITFLNSDGRIKPHKDGRIKPHTYTENTNNNNIINAKSEITDIASDLEAQINQNNTDNTQALESINVNAARSRASAPYGGVGIDIVTEIEEESKAVAASRSAVLEPRYVPVEETPVRVDSGEPVSPTKKRGRPTKSPDSVSSRTDLYPLENFKHDIRPLIEVFCEETGIKPFVKDSGLWYQQANIWRQLKVTPELIKRAVAKARQQNMTIKSPKSIEYLIVNPANLNIRDKKQGITMQDLVETYGARAIPPELLESLG